MLLNGKNALITGSNRGIGSAIMESFAKEGCNIFAHSRFISDEFSLKIKILADEYGVEITPVYFDLRNKEELRKNVNQILDTSQIHILVNNAGILHQGLFVTTPIPLIMDVFDINLFSAMEITQLVSIAMIRNRTGNIINIASYGGITQTKGDCAYGVSKAGMVAWTKVIAAELGRFNIRANAIAPGTTKTSMSENMNEKSREILLEHCAMKRLADPAEIADVALFLASDSSSFVNGEVICVDGGKV